jgi:hypothetical protein
VWASSDPVGYAGDLEEVATKVIFVHARVRVWELFLAG